MIYGKNVSPVLAEEIAEETASFHLPPDWRDGREVVEGLAIDDAKTKHPDDAIAVNSCPDGSYILSVSVADAGSFLALPSAIRKQARLRGHTQADKNMTYPLWPEEITRYFSLKNDAERPAITTHIPVDPDGELGEPRIAKSIIRAKRCTTDQFDWAVKRTTPRSDKEQPFSDFIVLGGLLHGQQTGKLTKNKPLPEHASPSTKFLTEVISAQNRTIGRFMLEHEIPALYQTWILAAQDTAIFGTTPDSRIGPWARATSPLWRFADFVCQANIIAYLDGEPFPFNEDHVLSIVEQYNARKLTKNVPSTIKAQGVHNSIRSQTAQPKDIMTAFAIPDGMPGSAKIRAEAFAYAVAEPQRAHNTIATLLSAHMLRTRHRRHDETAPSDKVLADTLGNVFPYWPLASRNGASFEAMVEKVRQRRDNAYTLAKIARLPEVPELPWELSEGAAEFLWAPTELRQSGFCVRYTYEKLPNGEVQAIVSTQRDGREYRVEATDKTERLARSKAAYNLLCEALPEPHSLAFDQYRIRQMRKLDPENPIGPTQYLNQFLGPRLRDGATRAKYEIVSVSEGDSRSHTCTISFSYEGTQHTITVSKACTGKTIKEIAALRALERIDAPVLRRMPNYKPAHNE